jgi:hypothetical protein
MTMTLLRSTQLPNGVQITFHDRSNRYFGDYHRVCIVVECRLGIELALFAGDADPAAALQKARTLLGEQLLVSRTLERMGVASADLCSTRAALIDSYLQSALPYLAAPEFPVRLLKKEMTRKVATGKLSLVRR